MFDQQEPGGADFGAIQQHFSGQQPNLGYGKQTEASIDAVNQWMRSQPWYQQIRGSSPKISDAQRRAILRAAQANGIVIDEGGINVDSSGNLDKKGHKLRNTLIVAGAAAAALTGGAALGAFGGAAGAGAGMPAAAGLSAGATGVGAGLPGAMATLPALSGGAGAAGGAGLLASSQIGSGAMGPIAGGTSGAGMMGGAASGGLSQTIARRIGDTAGDAATDSFKTKLAGALAAVGGGGLGKLLGGGGGSNIPPELQQLLAMSMQQQHDLDPLRKATTQGAYAMLPTFAKDK